MNDYTVTIMDLAGNTRIVHALMDKNSFNALKCENIHSLFLNYTIGREYK